MLSFLVSILSIAASVAFAGGSSNSNRIDTRTPRFRFGRPASFVAATSTATADAIDSTTSSTNTNTWEDLQNAIALDESENENKNEPVLTFYRDTNGWCPFCERVWVCIRAKNLPYQERLISLQNKPDWYKEMVPTTQVPALLFHNSNSDDKNSRKLVWDSLDIMKALDDMFPDTPQLVLDTHEYKEASEMNALLNKVGFAFVYATGGLESSGDGEQEQKQEQELSLSEKKQEFLQELDRLEQAIVGPFRLGQEFTGVDAEMIPSLERWRYQLPLSKGVDILENRPVLAKWFEAMESYAPFAERAGGDEYSWVATSAMFARFFGKEGDPATIATIEKSESAAMALMDGFKDAVKENECHGKFALEAAAKVISNHEAIAKDCTNPDPKSQQNISRAGSVESAEKMLLAVARMLLKEDNAIQEAKSCLLEDMGVGDDERLDAAKAAKTVATRLCTPRDMSAPAAKILRAVLMIVAERLEE